MEIREGTKGRIQRPCYRSAGCEDRADIPLFLYRLKDPLLEREGRKSNSKTIEEEKENHEYT
jgi:hypothetical protein